MKKFALLYLLLLVLIGTALCCAVSGTPGGGKALDRLIDSAVELIAEPGTDIGTEEFEDDPHTVPAREEGIPEQCPENHPISP